MKEAALRAASRQGGGRLRRPPPCVDSLMDECVAVAVAEAVAVAVTEAVAEADQSIHDQSIHDTSIHPRSITPSNLQVLTIDNVPYSQS